MEAVGRLAGGVAGDFNNMLTVIAGYAEMLRGEVPAGSPRASYVDEIVYAGERAATLTQHLLAFSRGGAAHPLVLDLNQLLVRHGADAAPPAGAEYRTVTAHHARVGAASRPTRRRSNRRSSTWRPMRATPCRTAASW